MTDGCVHLLNNSSWKFHQLADGQLPSGQPLHVYGAEKAGSTARLSHTKSHLPGHSTPASQAGRRVRPALYTLKVADLKSIFTRHIALFNSIGTVIQESA